MRRSKKRPGRGGAACIILPPQSQHLRQNRGDEPASRQDRFRYSTGRACRSGSRRIDPTIQLTNLWAHAGRKLFEVARNSTAPFAEDGIKRIFSGLRGHTGATIPFTLADDRVGMDSNTVKRTIRPIALSRKNALFADHDAGAENWATIAARVETCNLTPSSLTATLTAIVNGHKQSQVDDLLPWNYAAKV